jgi:hypothetical protein
MLLQNTKRQLRDMVKQNTHRPVRVRWVSPLLSSPFLSSVLRACDCLKRVCYASFPLVFPFFLVPVCGGYCVTKRQQQVDFLNARLCESCGDKLFTQVCEDCLQSGQKAAYFCDDCKPELHKVGDAQHRFTAIKEKRPLEVLEQKSSDLASKVLWSVEEPEFDPSKETPVLLYVDELFWFHCSLCV